ADLRVGGLRKRLVLTRDPILFDADPALVADPGQLGEEALQIDVAAAELAEDPAPPGLERVGAIADDAAEDVRPHVLDVHVGDARAPVAQRLDRIAAADQEMAGVDSEADLREPEQP